MEKFDVFTRVGSAVVGVTTSWFVTRYAQDKLEEHATEDVSFTEHPVKNTLLGLGAALAGAGVGLAVGVVAEEAFASSVIAFKEMVTK